MANEAVIVELLGNQGNPVSFTVADGNTIEKGTLLELSDPRTAAANDGSGDVFAGIAAAEKVANDGSTNLAAYTYGIFDLKDSGSGITVGQLVSTGGANTIKTATEAEIAAGKAIGKALETAEANEVIEVLVGGF